MIEMDDHCTKEVEIESYADPVHIGCANHAGGELLSMDTSSSEENQPSNNNIGGNAIGPVKDIKQYKTSQQDSGQVVGNKDPVDKESNLPNDHYAEAGIFEPVPIKEEKLDADYNEGKGLPFTDQEMLECLSMKEEQDVKSESDETCSDDSYSDEEELSDNRMSTENRQCVTKKDTKKSDSSNKFSHADKTAVNYAEGGTIAETEKSSKTIGGSPASKNDTEHNKSPTASPGTKEACRRRRKKRDDHGLANLVETRNKREKRSAFKKCTEWFKHLTGEMEDKYSCASCNRGFSSKRNLKEHQLSHKNVKSGDFDQKVFQTIKVMTQRLETRNGKFRCEKCHEVFTTKLNFTRHQVKLCNVSTLSCKICNRRFVRKETLLVHMQTHLDRDRGAQIKLNGRVTMLRMPVSRVRKFKCDECDARFTQKWSLEQHRMIHNKPAKDYECNECGKKFQEVSLLAKHQESHVGQKSYGCGECDERFTQKTCLIKHQLTHVERRKAECTECDLTFVDRAELKIHYLTIHGSENLCVCTTCKKSFSKQSALKRHLLTHTERKSFKCSVCKEIFAQKSTLTRHALLHGGEEFYRFVCSVCDRKFSRRETLLDHMRTHTGERPFVCAVCHEGFTQKSAMRRHQILHFKERRGKNSLPPVEVDTGTTDDILLSLVYSDT